MSKTAQLIGIAAAALSLGAGASAHAAPRADDPTLVRSEVYEATGDQAAIARRAQACMARILKPGLVNAPVIVSADVNSGVIVANNVFEYEDDGGIFSAGHPARAVFTLEAKDGRFRVTNSDIEFFLGRWRPAGDNGNGRAIKARLSAIAATVADCVKRPDADF